MDFANHPKSVAEVRSEREQNGSLWSPRDALIDVLRRIDSGEFVCDALVVACRQTTGSGRTRTYFASSSPDVHTSLGLLQHVAADLMRDS